HRGGEVGEAVVARRHGEDAGRGLAVVAERAELGRERVVVGEAGAALAGGDDLARVEAEAGDVAEAAARHELAAAPEGAGRVLDHDEPVEGLPELHLAHREAELVDDDRRLGARRALLAEVRGAGVPLLGVDVDEPHLEAERARGVRGARPGERRDEDLAPRLEPQGAEGELERGGAVRDADRVSPSGALREGALEGLHLGALNEPSAPEHARGPLDGGLVDHRAAEGDHRRRYIREAERAPNLHTLGMETKFLGRTGVRVSRLAFGTMTFGAEADERASAAIYARCRDAGINLFDCADVYSKGRAEEILGRLVSGHRDE